MTGSRLMAASSIPSISADGRFVVFLSRSENLVPSKQIGMFIRDRRIGRTELVSHGGGRWWPWDGLGQWSGCHIQRGERLPPLPVHPTMTGRVPAWREAHDIEAGVHRTLMGVGRDTSQWLAAQKDDLLICAHPGHVSSCSSEESDLTGRK